MTNSPCRTTLFRRWPPALALTLLFSPTPGRGRADEARLPRLYLIGDSTVKNGTTGLQGWGDPFESLFDPARVEVQNRARGGRSSRTFLTEGLWSEVLKEIKPGDLVLIQFGHNDGGPLTGGRARASLKGNGEETRVVFDSVSGKTETVHTYGWYLRRYASDAKSRGATPVILSPVPRNIWKDDGRVARSSGDYGRWAEEAARQDGTLFLDLNELVASAYEEVGREEVTRSYFGTDHTHTTGEGARVTAGIVARGLNGLAGSPFSQYLATPPGSAGRPATESKRD